MASVIEDVPDDSANSGGAGGAIETLDANSGCRWGLHKIRQGVGDAGCSTTINQDVERIRIKDRTRGLAASKSRLCSCKANSYSGLRKNELPPVGLSVMMVAARVAPESK